MATEQSQEELQSNLEEYRAQQQQVEQLLLSEPENEEYAEIYRSLTEVIQLTEDLLREAGGASAAAESSRPAPTAVVTEAPQMHLPSILPPQVAHQIRTAQQKAALSGQAPAAWAIGARCQAYSTLDGQWYTASVSGVSAAGNFVVVLEQGGAAEEVDRQRVRPIPDELETYRGVAAPTRKAVTESVDAPVEMPKWLEIKPSDDDKTKAKKKKLQKSYKSKQRFQKLDMATKQRQQSWLDFKKGKGAKRKAGFLSTGKKQSMFSVPDDPEAKVGVIGSGKGMTDYHDKNRHDFNPNL